MKKVLSIVLVIAVMACVGAGFAGCDKIFAPKLEREIVGTWISENGLLSYTFREDGTMSGNIEAIGVISVNGTYTVNSETNKVSVKYTVLGISYDKELDANLDEEVYTLTDKALGASIVYTRQDAE